MIKLRKIDIQEKVKWIDYFGSVAKNYGISIVYWECGGTKDDDFSIIDRKNLCIRPEQKAFADALTKAFEQCSGSEEEYMNTKNKTMGKTRDF